MRILITGGSGAVGRELTHWFRTRYDVISTFHSKPSNAGCASLQLDICDADMVRRVVRETQPSVVIHAAGNKDVRYCEANPEVAYEVNATGTRHVARACAQVGAHLVYISTDYVFPGERGCYSEADKPDPQTVYGQTKLKGEQYTLDELDTATVCRSAGVYGRDMPLLHWVDRELSASTPINAYVDVFNSPTYVTNLAEMLQNVIERRLVGVFHTVGRERTSRYQLFRAYARAFGYSHHLIRASRVADDNASAIRLPHDISLDSARSQSRLGSVAYNGVLEGIRRLRMSPRISEFAHLDEAG